MSSPLLRYQPEMELPGLELPAPPPSRLVMRNGRADASEMRLATSLLDTNSPQALDAFLRQLLSHAGLPATSPRHSSLRRFLFRLARALAPMAGSGIDHRLKPAAARIFRLELEGLSPEDKELEVAKRLVRFADAAARETAKQPLSRTTDQAVMTAITNSAQRYAPGLWPPPALPKTSVRADLRRLLNTGRWYRQGPLIIVNCG